MKTSDLGTLGDNFEIPLNREFKRVAREREKMGLPGFGEYSAKFLFYSIQDSKASVGLQDNGHSVITVQGLPFLREGLNKKNQRTLSSIMNYWDYARGLTGRTLHDSWILNLIEHPVKAFRRLESELETKGIKSEVIAQSEANGESYSKRKKILRQNSRKIREQLRDITPALFQASRRIDFGGSIRHEMDHVSFFQTPLYNEYAGLIPVCAELGNRLHLDGDQNASRPYAEKKRELIEVWKDVEPLLETRAHFFNFVPYNGWTNTPKEEAIRKVQNYVTSTYVRGTFGRKILDSLLPLYWSEGRMNRETSNYLFEQVAKSNADKELYFGHSCDLDQVDMNVANEILVEFGEVQNEVASKVRDASVACGNAFFNDPSRFRKAQTAESFEDYLEACS